MAPVGALNIGVYDQATGEIFVVSGGVFDHNRGTVNFVSVSPYWHTFTINVPTSLTLYDVSWSPITINSSYLTTAAGDTLIVSHDFTHVRGVLDGVWEVQGDYTVAAAADGGTASIAFTGGNVPQVLMMMNGKAQKMLTSPESLIFRNMEKVRDPSEKVERMFLTIMNRKPTMNEKDIAKRVLGGGEDGYANMIWALINTREFMFIQ